MKRLGVLISTLTALAAIGLVPPAEAAGSSCSGYTGGPKTIDFNAFAGHKVRATSWSKSLAKFRFSVHQGHVAVPVSSDYDFEIRVYPGGGGKICFVGRSCSSLQ